MHPPLIIKQYGVTLERLQEADIELVRNGRNQDFVRQNHLERALISAEQQKLWWQRINPQNDYYFLIEKQNKKIGMVYIKDLKSESLTGNIGIFIWDKNYLKTRIPALVTILFGEFFYCHVKIKEMRAVVLKTNTPMLNIFKFFEFRSMEVSGAEYLQLHLTRDEFESRRAHYTAFARRLARESATWELQITGTRSSNHLPQVNDLLSG